MMARPRAGSGAFAETGEGGKMPAAQDSEAEDLAVTIGQHSSAGLKPLN